MTDTPTSNFSIRSVFNVIDLIDYKTSFNYWTGTLASEELKEIRARGEGHRYRQEVDGAAEDVNATEAGNTGTHKPRL